MEFLIVFLGGAIGAVLRYGVTTLISENIELWLVNGLGSLLMGCLQAYFVKKNAPRRKLFLTTGILGAFTTFSAFSSQWLGIMETSFGLGVLYMVGMTFYCVVLASFGYLIMDRKEREA